MTNMMIESVQNPLVKSVAALCERKARQESGQILVETRHPIQEALRANLALKHYFYLPKAPETQRLALEDLLPHQNTLYAVSEPVMKKMASTDSLPPCLAVFEAPDFAWDAFLKRQPPQSQTPPLYVLVDKLQDPGNLGTLIRSAVAFGATGVILSAQSVEAASPKVIRASAGLVFACPIVQADESLSAILKHPALENCQYILTTGHPLWQGQVVNAYRVPDYTRATVVVFGNEGQGLDESSFDKMSVHGWQQGGQQAPRIQAIRIPMHERVESLNISVSAAVILAEAAHQRELNVVN